MKKDARGRGLAAHRLNEGFRIPWKTGHGWAVWCLTPLLVVAGASGVGRAADTLSVALTSGDIRTGQFASLDAERLVLAASPDTAATELAIDLATVRRITLQEAAPAAGGSLIGLTDGSQLTATSIEVTAAEATVSLATGSLALPADGLHWIAWSADDETPPTTDWLAELPNPAAGDIVVIRRDEGWQFIECAITAITATEVVVLLEGESIPVSRTKLAGLCWLRDGTRPGVEPEPAAQDILLGLPGGRLRCRGIARATPEADWTLTLAATTTAPVKATLPAAEVLSIDYAFGRQIDLTRRSPASTAVEPYFGSLADDAVLRRYFAPRAVTSTSQTGDQAEELPALLLRPRTDLVWTLPPGSRVFRAQLLPAKPAASTPTLVLIEVDGVEQVRREIGGAGLGVDTPATEAVMLDVRGGRQLRLVVDFATRPAGDAAAATPTALLGGPILLQAPTIER